MSFTFCVVDDAVSLACDDCLETVCAIDDEDDLRVIVQMADDHAGECQVSAGGES